MLQFRIWHLLALTAGVAIAITVVDLMSYRTITVSDHPALTFNSLADQS